MEYLQSSIVVRIKNGVGSCIGDGFDRLLLDQYALVPLGIDTAQHTVVRLLR